MGIKLFGELLLQYSCTTLNNQSQLYGPQYKSDQFSVDIL